MTNAMRLDLRTMAVNLLGDTKVPEAVGYQKFFSEPIISHADLDEVAIHLRCGDVFLIKTDSYGIIGYDVYRKQVSPQAKSIGIITQSFDPKLNRDRDRYTTRVCMNLTAVLGRYLHTHFPNATISVRNNKNETPATAYSRLVLANQSFSGLSTFSIFPAIASFGTSYIPKGRSSYFCPAIEKQYDNVKMIDGEVLTSNRIRTLLKHPDKFLSRLTGENIT